ncbi:hypothetical protein BU26DRAFT_475293 [Trematosphaeria pertusa]|uniref:Uncharacterized protein n=1 Tax=Trematosphaeria pertusa TaxID=390896 RepID=A0A6A6J097_9PLEO|nr:uncharacterized protein BU26DRAFT_475293 [Trematosphaeria pertusa]KAF2254823.1 hypothetical protein BU26DRAFT_475293 [Trematosphaeria pertusa]
MPIPPLNSSLRPRSYLSSVNDSSARLELSRRPAHDEPTDAVIASDHRFSAVEPRHQTLRLQNNADDQKKRSYLPQRGLPKPIPRTAGRPDARGPGPQPSNLSAECTSAPAVSTLATQTRQAGTQESKVGRLRPRSMYQSSSVHRDRDTKEDVAVSMESAQPSEMASRPASSHAAGLNRTQSLRRPGPGTQQAESNTSRGHSRTQSTSTVTSSRKPSEDSKAQAGRPKSLLVAPTHGHATRPTTIASTDATAGGVRTSARLEALKRSASTRARPEVIESRAMTGAAIQTDDVLQPQARRREEKEELKRPSRPAFTTLQQHFTPRKTGKAPTSVFLRPAPEPGPQSLPPEIISLQSELLQLHHVMREYERHGQEQENILALREWSGANSLSGLVEQIQALSGPLHELPSLLDSGGRFDSLASDFARWATWVEDVWTARGGPRGQGGDFGSLEGLGDSWKVENAALTRKLTAFSRDMKRLPQPASGSSVGCIISICKELLGGLLRELQVMQVVESSVVAGEKEWIEERLNAIARDVGARLETNEGRAAWRE